MTRVRAPHPAGTSDGERRRLIDLVGRFQGRKVVVLGDLIADEFIYGRIARVSREAPVLILRYDSTEIVPGGAGNAANNVAALGGRAIPIGVVGRDEAGRRLVASLQRGVRTGGMVRARGYLTPTKTRILAGGIHSAKQQVVRIDRESGVAAARAVHDDIARRAEKAVDDCDALIVSDYGFGVVTPALVARLRAHVKRNGRRPPVLVDSRYALLRYSGLTACTPNESEVEQLLGLRIDDAPDVLERAGRTLLERTGMEAVLITRGSRGMALYQPKQATVHIPIFGSDQIADVTGAGDTVIATMTIALAAGATFLEAARLANYAGGLVVMKRGTATVGHEELRHAIERDRGQ